MANSTSEQWLPVVGYEGLYEVSDKGRVRSRTRGIIMRQSLRGRVTRMTNPTRG